MLVMIVRYFIVICFVFFCKQKTAYEMRISDWSSDVCSSDLLDADLRSHGTSETYTIEAGLVVSCIGYQTPPIPGVPYEHGRGRFASDEGRIQIGRASCRERVCQYV